MRLLDRYQMASWALPACARVLSPWLPPAWHPGKRASSALGRLTGFPLVANQPLSRAVLQSQWQSNLLRRYAEQADPAELDDFLSQRVRESGARPVSAYANEARAVILAAPHYGAYVLGCLAALQRFHGRKPFHVFYDDPQRNPHNHGFDRLFSKLGRDVGILLNNRRGLVATLKALRQGACLALMPDVFHSITETMPVPVLGRLLRVMTGTAFFALKGDALIVPTYALPAPGFCLELATGPAIDPRRYGGHDEEQALFLITRDLFAELSSQLGSSPEHWIFWESFATASTPLHGIPINSTRNVERAIGQRCRELPQLLRHAPLLATLDLHRASAVRPTRAALMTSPQALEDTPS